MDTPFRRVVRLWRYLTADRQSGNWFALKKYNPVFEHAPLAVRCMACPVPNLNMDPDWQQAPERLK